MKQNAPDLWTYLIEGFEVRWMNLTKCNLFMYEVVKQLKVHERARASFEVVSPLIDHHPAVTVLCGITESEIALTTYPGHEYARLLISTGKLPQRDVTIISAVFRDFFHARMQTERYLAAPEGNFFGTK